MSKKTVDKTGWNIEWAKGGAVTASPSPVSEVESVEPAEEIKQPKPAKQIKPKRGKK